MNEWIHVNDDTERMKVCGGWIVRTTRHEDVLDQFGNWIKRPVVMALVFVPDNLVVIATAAMQAMITKSSGQDRTGGKTGVPLIAMFAYEYADAMIKQSEVRP